MRETALGMREDIEAKVVPFVEPWIIRPKVESGQ